ncbi:hypothetical protein L1049_007115 [Liquidambar formosana]|uniref:Uncharacterized protein n=1 Tax=Liquidambar formosana TaxID=63359 RepID=A0AAP0WV09_LIQFO
MYLIESKGGAIACMLLALFFLGTWPAIMTLLERRGRLPQHTYLDYTITNLLAAVIIALTFGEIGKSTAEMPNFFTQLSQDNWTSILFAMAGGVVLSLGNLSTQYAWAFVGLSVTEVVTSSITVVIGTTLNYFLDDKINKAKILFPGVGCFLIAVCLGSAVHSSNAADNKAKLSRAGVEYVSFLSLSLSIYIYIYIYAHTQLRSGTKDLENGSRTAEKSRFGSAEFLVELENRRSIKVFGRNIFIGLAITIFAGLCFSLFTPAFNLATNDQWHTLKHGVPHLVVYTAFFYFSVSCFVLALILNISFLYRPVLNTPKSSLKAYLNDWNGRGWAFLAGLLCGFGNGLQFMGGQAAGYAAADAVQDFSGIPSLITLPIERIISSGLKMYVVESKAGAIVCMLLSLLLLGTWPSIFTLLERRGRLPQHTYLDYSITNLLAAVIIALTFGEIGESTPEEPNFITQLSQDNWPCVLFAVAGGVVLSLGNLSTQYALAFVGLSVTLVITASITVVIGTTMNYFLDDKINKAEILFPGVGCFLIAVFLASAVHASNAADNKAKLRNLSIDYKNEAEYLILQFFFQYWTPIAGTKDLENQSGSADKAQVGSADFLIELENRRSIKVFGKSTFIGLAIAIFAVVLNIIFLYHPVLNLPRSSLKAYLNDWNGRGWALLAGILCGFGNGLQFMGGEAAGYAAADAVQVSLITDKDVGVRVSGTSTREYILGYSTIWGVQKIFKKNIYIARKHVVHVYSGCCPSHGIGRESGMIM